MSVKAFALGTRFRYIFTKFNVNKLNRKKFLIVGIKRLLKADGVIIGHNIFKSSQIKLARSKM